MWYYLPGFGRLLCTLQQFAVTCWSTGESWLHVSGRVAGGVRAKCFPTSFGKATTGNRMREFGAVGLCNRTCKLARSGELCADWSGGDNCCIQRDLVEMAGF